MTLFKITCDTCQTSLNVRQKSAIGQILACPKCGSMVQVKAPEEWDEGVPESTGGQRGNARPFVKPKPDPSLPETESNISNSLADDVRAESTSNPNRVAAPPRQRGNETRWQGDEQTPLQSDSANASDEPLLPGEHWFSPRARQRKKLLIAFASTAAVLVIGIGAIIFAVLQLSGDGSGKKNSESVAKADSVSNQKQSAESEAKKNREPVVDPEKNKGADGKPKNGNSGLPVDPNAKTTENKKQTPDALPTDDTNASEKGDPSSKTDEPPGSGKATDVPGKGDSSDAPPIFSDSKEDADDTRMEGFFGDLDAFAAIFKQNDSLLTARKGFTEEDLPGNYGQTRFFIERSLKKAPDRTRALQIPIKGLQFEEVTLLQFLDFHYGMTSYPVAVDVTPILLSGVSLDQKVRISLVDTTFEDALKQFAAQLKLSVIRGKNSLVLTIPDRDNLIEVEYPVSDIASSAQDRQLIIEQIQKFINRASWSEVGGAGIVTANDQKDSIVVKHFGWAQVRVRELLRNMRDRTSLPRKNPNVNFPASQTRLALANQLKNKKLTLFESDPVSLSKLAAILADKYDIHVFINWESTGDRWLPSGSLPLAVDGEDAEQILEELAETMSLETVWHSDKVVEFTTAAGAATNLTFESYDISTLVTKRFKAEDLKIALKKLLESNRLADFDRAAIGIDQQHQNALYAVLPQSAHRNVEGILTAIANRKPR